jgi:hypothetical protein
LMLHTPTGNGKVLKFKYLPCPDIGSTVDHSLFLFHTW